MKKNRIFFLTAICSLLGIYSCTEDTEYNPARIPSNSQAFFAKDTKNEINLELNQSSFDIDILRTLTDKSLTVDIELNDTSNIFTAPSTITFDKDKDSAQITISFDFDKITADNNYEISFKITSADTSEYAPNTLSVIVKYAPWTNWYSTLDSWTKAGYKASDWVLSQKDSTCSFTYSLYTSGTDEKLPIQFRQSLQNPNKGQFRIQHWFYDVDLIIDYDKTKAVNNCTFSDTYTGYSNIYVMPAVAFFEVFGPDRIAAGRTNLNLTYADSPLTYDKDNGNFVLNIVYHAGIGYYGCGPEYCQVDGFTQYDYSVKINYLGSYQNDLNNSMGAVVSLQKGKDVSLFRYNIFNRELSDAQIDSVGHEIDYLLTESFESSTDAQRGFVLPTDGDYTVVSVSYNENGDSVGINSLSFYYNPPMLWKSLGYCNYTDGLLIYTWTEDETLISTYSVEIQESTIYPNIYRLKNPYGAGYPYNSPGDYSEDNTYIVIDASDPDNVFIPEQKMGINRGDGEMSVATQSYGLLSNDSITFPINGLAIDLGGDKWYDSNQLGEFCVDLKNISAQPSQLKKSPMYKSYTPVINKKRVNSNRKIEINSVSTKKTFNVSNETANSLRHIIR
jgi:hypothetical protein